jgi:hypothetical protein
MELLLRVRVPPLRTTFPEREPIVKEQLWPLETVRLTMLVPV